MITRKSIEIREIRSRLRYAVIQRPYTLTFSVILPIPGVLGIIYGSRVSRALETIAVGQLSRLMGAALLVGSLMALIGIGWGKTLCEATGLTIMAAGCVIYGLGVILGLGLAGAVAGSGFLAIATGTLLRIISLASVAHERHGRDNGDGD